MDTAESAPLQRLPIEFTGSGDEYFRIWIVNLLLTIVTLGIYSAWAKVRKHQYFYRHTLIENSSFDYLASPLSILKGRLIALGIFIVYFISTQLFPAAAALFIVLFIVALPWLIVRTLKFRLTNTAYRNIRFRFTGSAGEAAVTFLLLPLLIPFSLGLLYPMVAYKQKKFLFNHAQFGTTPFQFQAQLKDFYRLYLKIIIPIVLLFIAMIALIASSFFMAQSGNDMPSLLTIGITLIPLLFYGFLFFAMVYIQTRIYNLIWNTLQLGNQRFASDLKLGKMLWIYFSNIVVTVFSLGLMIPWATVRMTRYHLENMAVLIPGTLENFTADESQKISATGEEISEMFDIDIGI